MSQLNQRLAQLSPEQRAALEAKFLRKAARKPKASIIPKRSPSEPCPLSLVQQRLWFFQQLEPENTIYHIYVTLRLQGNLSLEALQQALNTIVERHEALRTRFIATDGAPAQVITPTQTVDLPLLDLSNLPAEKRAGMLKSLLEQDTRRPFDLRSDLMLRSTLIRLNQQEHVLQVVMHHIASDGLSVKIFTQEFCTLYQAFSAGKPNSLPELPVQYADFAEWQRQWLSDEILNRQLGYWKQQLAGAPPLLELPTDYPRPLQPSYRGANFSFTVSKDISSKLQQLSQQTSSTLFMTLLAAFNVLLYRYTRQEDIVVGSPIANRSQIEVERLIGFFVNTLVLRTDLSGNPSFRQLLQRVRQVALDAYENQDVPFEKLVEELKPERNLSYSPLFQVMFALQSSPIELQEIAGLSIQPECLAKDTSMFDLTLTLTESTHGLSAEIEYTTDLFTSETIERMAGQFQTLLESIVANPDQSIAVLPLLTAAEHHQLLVEWNDTQSGYPQEQCIHQLIEAQVERTPDAIAVVFDKQQLTYRELNERANQLAYHLQSLGVGADTLVGICVERSIDMVIGILGILKAGGAYVPIDPIYPHERKAHYLRDSQATIVLTQYPLVLSLPDSTAQIICLDTEWHTIARNSTVNPPVKTTPQNLAYCIYTSGSTGTPKGVLVIHRGVVNHCTAMVQTFALHPSDRCLQFSSVSFDIFVEELFPCLVSGATLVLRSENVAASARHCLSFVEQHQITVLNLPTAFWHELVAGMDLLQISLPTSVRLVVVGGEKASQPLYHLWVQLVGSQVRWLNTYGPTEATVTTTTYDPIASGFDLHRSTLPIGRPIVNAKCYVLDQQLQPVPIGVPGELHVGGIGLARGYLNRSEQTNNVFIPDPFSDDPAARLYKTGDIVRYLSDGNLEFIGRVDFQVKIRGFRIELEEIETVLNQHPEVQQCVVIDYEDEPGNKRLVSYVVSTGNESLTAAELRQFLQQKLPAYMLPSAFVKLDSLPLTPNGKVDRHCLPKPEASDLAVTTAYVAPRTPSEQNLADIWRQVLKLDRVGIHDNFFELGGHSLLAVQVITRIQDAYQIDFPIRRLFEFPTIAQLDEAVKNIHWFLQPLSVHQEKLQGVEEGEL